MASFMRVISERDRIRLQTNRQRRDPESSITCSARDARRTFRGVVMLIISAPAMRRSRLKLVFASLFLLPLANTSNATQVTSTFAVQLNVTSSCDFGSQGVLTANVDNTSTLAVQCTNTTPYNIGFDAGTGN